MSESSSEHEIFGATWAARICLALIVGLAIVIAVAVYDEHRLSALEGTESNTAVGDNAFFAPPAGTISEKPPGAVITFNGKALYPVSSTKYQERDSRMVRQGLDDSKAYSVYSSSAPVKAFKGESVIPGDTFYFLKLAPGVYLKLRTTAAGK